MGPNNQRLYLNGTRVAHMSDTQSIDLSSACLGIGRHVSGIADPFNGYIDEFRISHVQRSDGWIETTWNNMSDPGAFAAAGAEEQAATPCRRRCRRLPDGVRANVWCRAAVINGLRTNVERPLAANARSVELFNSNSDRHWQPSPSQSGL
jgi:hypothetical protein